MKIMFLVIYVMKEKVKKKTIRSRWKLISHFHFIQTKRRRSMSAFHFNQTKRRRSISRSLLFISIKQKRVGQFFVKKNAVQKIHFDQKRRRSISPIHFIPTKRRRLISPFHFTETKMSQSIFRQKEKSPFKFKKKHCSKDPF